MRGVIRPPPITRAAKRKPEGETMERDVLPPCLISLAVKPVGGLEGGGVTFGGD